MLQKQNKHIYLQHNCTMKRYIVIFCLTFFPRLLFSQGIGGGTVINLETNLPIPYATIYYLDIGSGTLADSIGTFSYFGELPKDLTIKVSAIGYANLIAVGNTKTSALDTFFLEPSHLQLEEIIVSSLGGKIQNQTISNIESRQLSELNVIQPNTLGEAISNIPGVYQSTTGIGISKPVIRGLSGSRIVTYLNGLRIENQQWGGDHGMGVDEIGIGSVEIIKGPASLLFGADALGGVVYFVDEPYANQNSFGSKLSSKFNSVTMGFDNTLSLRTAKKNIRVNAYLNYANHADYQIPNSLYVKNSRFKKTNAKVSIGFNRKKWVSNIRYSYLYNRIGLPGHTHEEQVHSYLFLSTEQNRKAVIPAQSITNHYLLFNNKFYLANGEVVANIGYTSNQLTEFDEKVSVPGINMTLSNGLYNLYYKGDFSNGLKLTGGIQGMYQNNSNHDNASEMLVPDAVTFDNGAYLLANFAILNWVAEGGVRLDSRVITTTDVFNGNDPINNTYSGVNYSFGVSRDSKKSTIRGNISSGYRAPQSIELLAHGVHHGTLTYDIGDQDLKSEKAIQADISYEYHSEHFEFVLNPFYNRLQDYIYRSPQDSAINDLPVFEYKQANHAVLNGGSIGFHYHPHFIDNLHLESSYSTVYAVDDIGNPLPRMPHSRVNTFFKFELTNSAKVKLKNVVVQHQYFLPQSRIAQVETTSKGYNLINVGINLEVGIPIPIELGMGVKNVFNEEYIDHLSRLKILGLNNPGRNFYVNLIINLSKSSKKQKP